MGWSEGEKRCKKHPEHKQSKGVCPNCLRERLHHLSASSSSSTSKNASSTTSRSLHSDESRLSSPGAGSLPRRPVAPLKKSRSLAFVLDREKEKEQKENRKKKKTTTTTTRGRFWSRLLGRDGGLERSKTLREKSTTN